ncbi:hypothetical protein Vadar_032805 [Vaccinium darrowii]|uniref:Uncharacterized protein n=1 Tax=Vaccinium darrowii TaxID=229202 RepID=A0ACB7XV75_9ERIC|nr:hypothetical protein Vadar_032805 [Vaccinium darrowii]
MEPKKGSEKGGKGKNFRWSKPMQSLLFEILVDEATKGNKPSNTFKPGSFAKVAKEIIQKYGVECQSKYVENRLKTIKSTWKIISDLRYMKSGFGWDDNLRMITCGENVSDEYIAAHPEHEAFFNKKIEMYDEMALVVGKELATGQLAKSFDDIEEETVAKSDSIDFSVAEVSKGKCTTSSTQIGEVTLAIKKLSDDRLNVKDLYDEVMKTEGFNEFTLASAFDHLVENKKVAKTFMVKSASLRRAWLEGFFNMNA